ncbi:cyclin-dependent kinase F-4-like [Curcuma longa]|uniref:cyclin-dependent kinase F-4-like n=1 Tax=Curcuma longa TaxID=136217 RepID=UPI003D9F209F
MERYNVIKKVGDGTFGNVWRAISKQSGELVAIKKLKRKYYSWWEECLNLQEVKSLRRLNHPNIVKLKEVIRENDILYLVFEYMECSLYQLMKERRKSFSEVEIRNWCFQIFRALAYMHQHSYFHRDLKPENLLVTKDLVKIADFGLAREIHSKPPFTEYVSTRWYRAPELLLHSSVYNSAVDMWAMGAIMAELFTLHPLFPGSSEADQLCKICSVIGSPNGYSWSEGLQLAAAMKYRFPQFAGVPLSVVIRSASKEAIDLISSLCSWDPRKRLTALEVLQHPFFKPCVYIPPSPQLKSEGVKKTPSSAVTKSALVAKSAREHSVGVLSSTRLPRLANANGFSRTGAQRNLEMNHQDWQREKISDNGIKTHKHQSSLRDIQGVADRDAKSTSNVVEKLADLKLNWNDGKQPHLKPCPVRQSLPKDAVWHRHAGVLGQPEVPLQPTYYARKVAG